MSESYSRWAQPQVHPPTPALPRWRPPPVDWRQEMEEREARERAARPVVEAEPPPVEDEETTPAKPTPRLNKARAWRREMMRPDLGGAA